MITKDMLLHANREQAEEIKRLRGEVESLGEALQAANAALAARLADLEGMMEIIAPLAYAQWQKGHKRPITGDSASFKTRSTEPATEPAKVWHQARRSAQ